MNVFAAIAVVGLGLAALFVVLFVRLNRMIARALAESTQLERAVRLAYDGPPLEEIVAGNDPQLIADELRHEARERR